MTMIIGHRITYYGVKALRGQRHMLAKIDPGNLSLGNIAQEEFWAQVNFRGEWMPSVFTLKQEFTWSWWTFKSALLDETKQRLRRRLRPTPPFRHFTLPCKFFVPRAIFVLGWNISWKVCEALMEIHTTQLKFFSFLQWINEMETLKKPLWFCCVKSSSYFFFFTPALMTIWMSKSLTVPYRETYSRKITVAWEITRTDRWNGWRWRAWKS